MADQRNHDLPEGTDKIIGGAGNAALPGGATGPDQGGRTVTADTSLVKEKQVSVPDGPAERRVSGSGSPQGGIRGTSSSSDGGGIGARLRSGKEQLTSQAGEKARGMVGQGLERSSEALANVSRMVGDTAPGIEERLGPEYGDYARRAAGAIEDVAQSLAEKNPDELIEDTRNFVRNSPGVALAGAAVVGFVIARLVKSGLSGVTGRDDDDRDSGNDRA